MKRHGLRNLLIGFMIFILGVMFFGAVVPARASVEDFSFKSFEGDYYLSRDAKNVSQLKVVEKIVAVFPDYDQNHGLRRAIPKTYKGNSVDLKVLSVVDGNGRPRAYKLSSQNGNEVISIRSSTFLHGEQTYIITYKLQGVISFEADQDEWYWDTNGDQWSQTFGSVVARAHIPPDLRSSLLSQQKCFTGVYGSKSSDCTMVRRDGTGEAGETVVTVTSNVPLRATENMSLVLGFTQDTFTAYKPTFLELLGGMIWTIIELVLPSLIALMVVIFFWVKYGRDPKDRRTVVAQYRPPKDMNPMLAGFILDGQFNVKVISATILDLCIRGHIKLYEVSKKSIIGSKSDYELELLATNQNSLTEEERKVISLLFSTNTPGQRVALKDLSHKLSGGAQELGKTLNQKVTKVGYFRRDPSKVVVFYASIGGGIMVVGAVLLKVLVSGIAPGVGILAAGLVVILLSRIMPALSIKGVETKNYLKGLKLYMHMAEADRIKMLQSPTTAEKTSIDVTNQKQLVKLYEKLLPYAMLFGIEKEWAKQFAGMYEEQPSWYSSNTAFNAMAFSHSLNHFGSVASTSFTAPTSSGSSGFGGGGFSGGGGGGGGGGGL